MSTRRRAFETFIEGYLDDLATLGYDELVDEQPPPYAALACGAAGIAYTLWRAGRALAAPALGEAARRWIDAAEMRREHAGSFAGPERVDASLYFGPAGLDLIAALEIGTADSAALSRFARAARAAVAAAESADLLLGTAGLLVGASILAAHVPGRDAAILEAELLDAVVSAEPAGPSMGHGETGALFAALGVYERRSKPPPAALVGRVEALPDEVPPPPAGSFCRGAAGRAILWARTAALTGEPEHRERARAYAGAAYDQATAYPDLCCGLVGVGYAMLALSRLESAADWIERAERVAVFALTSELETEWPGGLLKGEAGLFCLVLDLVRGSSRAPALEPER